MSAEEAEEVIKSQPPDTSTLSPAESRRLREAYLVREGHSEEEIRKVLTKEYGELD